MTRKYSPCLIKLNSDKRLLFAVENKKKHHEVQIHRPSNSLFFSRPRTRCTSTVRSGTSYLAQRRTKTQPTSASMTPPRVKPLHTISHLLCSFQRKLAHVSSIVHHHLLLLLFSRVMLLAVDLFNRSQIPSCTCRHMIRTTLPSQKPLYRSSTIFQYAFSKLFLENLKT